MDIIVNKLRTKQGRDSHTNTIITSGEIIDSRTDSTKRLFIMFKTGNRSEVHCLDVDIDELLNTFTVGMVEKLHEKLRNL